MKAQFAIELKSEAYFIDESGKETLLTSLAQTIPADDTPTALIAEVLRRTHDFVEKTRGRTVFKTGIGLTSAPVESEKTSKESPSV